MLLLLTLSYTTDFVRPLILSGFPTIYRKDNASQRENIPYFRKVKLSTQVYFLFMWIFIFWSYLLGLIDFILFF